MPETALPIPEHLPFFITGPGETDVLMNVMIGVVIGIIVLIGVFYLKLHALPERLAHRRNKVQLEIVAVLALLALLTHNNIFWVAALLLAMIQLPDLSGLLGSMARSLERMAAARAPYGQADAAVPLRADRHAAAAHAPHGTAVPRHGDDHGIGAAGAGEGRGA
jgi:hypothetical protein